jgi:hypothetical protein
MTGFHWGTAKFATPLGLVWHGTRAASAFFCVFPLAASIPMKASITCKRDSDPFLARRRSGRIQVVSFWHRRWSASRSPWAAVKRITCASEMVFDDIPRPPYARSSRLLLFVTEGRSRMVIVRKTMQRCRGAPAERRSASAFLAASRVNVGTAISVSAIF